MKYTIPIHKTAMFEKFPLYMGKRLFNKLPNTIKNEPSYNRFRNLLRDFLMEETFYSVQEYLSH